MYNKESFPELWQDCINAMQFEVKRLVSIQDKFLIKHINGYYKIRILKGLWYSETFVNDHNIFMAELKETNEEKYNQVKEYLLSHTTLITQDEESILVRNIMMGGGVGAMLLGALRNNKKLLILSLGISALGYFYNEYNQKKIVERATAIVRTKMEEIGKNIVKIIS